MEVRQAMRRLMGRGRSPSRAPETKVVLADYYAALQSAGLYQGYRSRPWPVERAVCEAYERVVWVFKAVESISGHASSLPFRLKQGEEVLDDHPLYQVMNRRANPMETARQFRKRLSAQLLLSKRGAFVEVTRARNGDIVRLDLLPPGRTMPVPGTGQELISHYEVLKADGSRTRIDVENVKWFRDPHPLDPYSGVTPLEAAGMSVELDFFTRLYNVAFLKNDARPGGVLAVNGEMDEKSMDRIEDRFGKGAVEAGKLTVIAGEVSYVDLAAQPRDMAHETTAAIAKKEILTAFGVPESVIGDASDRTFDNADQEEYNYWSITMPPHLSLITTGMDEDSSDDLEGFFDTEDIAVLQRPKRLRREEARTEFEAGLISIDEYREVAGYEAIDNEHSRSLWLLQGKQEIPTSEADAKTFGLAAQEEAQQQIEIAQAQKQPPPGQEPAAVAEKPPSGGDGAAGSKPAAGEPSGPRKKHLMALPPAPAAARPVIRLVRPAAETKDAPAGAESTPAPAMFDKLETALSAALTALMVRLAARTVTRLTSPKARKGTRHWTAAYKVDLRVGSKAIDADQAVDAQRWQEETEQAAHPIVEAAAIAAAAALLADFGSPDTPDAVAPVVAAIVAILGKAAADQAGKLAALMRQRDDAGDSIEQIEQAVHDYGATLASWADQISVQAATATINGARSAAAQAWTDAEPGREVKGMWNTRRDGKVRPSHVKAQGQQQPVGEPFDVGGSLLMFPGDPDGPPHEVWNCRCWLSHRSTVTGLFVPTPAGARIRMTRAEREMLAGVAS